MYNFLLSLSCLFFFFHTSHAQRFDWAQEIGSTNSANSRSYCYGITYDSMQDCSYVIGVQNYLAFVRKTSATGSTIWQKDFGNRTIIAFEEITQDKHGNIYILGTFDIPFDIDPSPLPADTFILRTRSTAPVTQYQRDVFILKLDSIGQFLWATVAFTPKARQANSIVLDDDENIYLTGVAIGSTFVEKIDVQGNFLWTHYLGNSLNTSPFSFRAHPKRMATDGQHLYITGDYYGTVDLDPSPTSTFLLQSNVEEDIFLLKLDLDGNFMWANSFGYEYRDYVNAIDVDARGDIYTAGCYFTQDSIWAGGTDSIAVSRGPFYYLHKSSSFGRDLWFKTIDQEILALDASQGGFVYATGREKISSGNHDIIIQKWSSNNALLWSQRMLSAYADAGEGIAVTPVGDVYAVGYFEGIVDFDLSTSNRYLYATGTTDGFILKLAPQTIAIPYLQTLQGVQLYPNPTQGAVRVTLEEPVAEGSLELMNSQGQVLYQRSIDSNAIDVDINTYPRGTYMVRIRVNNKVTTLQLVKA